MSKLYDDIDRVTDARSFAAFAARLRLEVASNAERTGPFPCENYDIDSFLEAMQEWASTGTAAREIPASNPWRAAARFLLVGHYYE